MKADDIWSFRVENILPSSLTSSCPVVEKLVAVSRNSNRNLSSPHSQRCPGPPISNSRFTAPSEAKNFEFLVRKNL
nr:hypothetical transcript [Hymenolepis microstoma]